jgi:hypothetical protein
MMDDAPEGDSFTSDYPTMELSYRVFYVNVRDGIIIAGSAIEVCTFHWCEISFGRANLVRRFLGVRRPVCITG